MFNLLKLIQKKEQMRASLGCIDRLPDQWRDCFGCEGNCSGACYNTCDGECYGTCEDSCHGHTDDEQNI